MAALRSRTADISQYRGTTSHTRRLQEGLYTHLDEQEKAAFIEVLNTYGVRRDIFELVNSLRKILNTPVKRQLFPLVRGVIRKSDMEAFDLLTRGGKNYGTLPRPFLYRPHAADISVLRKHRTMTLNRFHELSHKRKASSLVSDFSDRDESLLQDPGDRGDVHKVYIETRDSNYDSFGFNIRGGSEYGLGVYVSSVDEGGPAEIQGLQVGDLIVEANDISFQKISHGEAARMIQAANRLELSVCRVGRVPGSHTVHEAYKWVDARGRPVSPPSDLLGAGHTAEDTDTRSRSSLNLLKSSDERKVNVVVDRGHSLGLTVRGGQDYGLVGIYISGVDAFSVAENAGLKIGDQILDVNGQSMLGVRHSEAVRTLTRCRHMVLTVRDVGRVPYAKTTIDKTRWISKQATLALDADREQRGRLSAKKSVSEPDLLNVGFSRGAGSQLMLSAMSTRPQQDVVEEQARLLLNTEEQATLRYYLTQYSRGLIQVPGFVAALMELFNTGAKFTLMSEIRPQVQAKDLGTFDRLVHRQELQTGFSQSVRGLDADSLSLISGDSADAFMDDYNKRTLFSSKIKPVMKPMLMDALTADTPSITTNATNTPSTTTSRHKKMSEKNTSRMAGPSSVDQWDTLTDMLSENGSMSRQEFNHHHRQQQQKQLHQNNHNHNQQQQQQQQQQNQQKQQGQTAPSLTRPVTFTRPQAARRQKISSRPLRPRVSPPPIPTLLHVGRATQGSGSVSAGVGTVVAVGQGGGGGVEGGGSSRVTYTKADVHPRGKVDEPSDDSGVEVNNPQPLDPRAMLGLDSGRLNPNRHSKRVTISKAVPVDIDTAVGRQPADAQVGVRSHGQPSNSTSASLNQVNSRSREEQRRVDGRDKYGDIPLGVVYIYRCKPTLGVAIEGGANTRQPLPRVVTVQPGGSAFESGGLKVGHVILEVNGRSLVGMSHTEVAKLIAETFKNREEDRMELLVTDCSESAMEELRSRLAGLSVEN